MEERCETEKAIDEVILPGFRFHPTDEELVGFYLKRKVQHRPLSIELIKQLDIYKHDPWDLPKLASTGEKEWYFYCPRDRKYRNSARPNRVTGAGFWKATGTDRPIYSSEGTKCIGLKKSLVFYKGRAAKGVKTDWMMHEFRLPSLVDHSASTPKRLDKSFPANDSWAICRIFKKANSTAQRALSHSWVSPFSPEPSQHDHHNNMFPNNQGTNSSQFSSETISNNVPSLMSTTGSSPIQFCCNRNSTDPLDFVSYKPYQSCAQIFPSLLFSPLENNSSENTSVPSSYLNMSSSILGDAYFGSNKTLSHQQQQQQREGTDLIAGMISHEEIPFPYLDHQHGFQEASSLGNFDHQNSMMIKKYLIANEIVASDDQDQWEAIRSSLGFPFMNTNLPLPSLPLSTSVAEPWKPSLLWDTSPCPNQAFTNFPSTR